MSGERVTGLGIYDAPEGGQLRRIIVDPTRDRLTVAPRWLEEELSCEHEHTWFDRTFCPEPCGSMHTRCNDCGWHGSCANDTPVLM